LTQTTFTWQEPDDDPPAGNANKISDADSVLGQRAVVVSHTHRCVGATRYSRQCDGSVHHTAPSAEWDGSGDQPWRWQLRPDSRSALVRVSSAMWSLTDKLWPGRKLHGRTQHALFFQKVPMMPSKLSMFYETTQPCLPLGAADTHLFQPGGTSIKGC
jgi:hypothetical protein